MTQSIEHSDAAWIQASRNGDRTAFGRLVRKYLALVHAKAMLLTRDPHEAEDLVQETFMKAFKRLNTLKDDQAFGPWLLIINRNLAFTKYRKAKREGVAVPIQDEAIEDESETTRYYDDPDSATTRARLLDAIEELPEQYRLPILLHYMEGLSYRDIQVKLDLSHAAIKGVISRGVVKLRETLKRTKALAV